MLNFFEFCCFQCVPIKLLLDSQHVLQFPNEFPNMFQIAPYIIPYLFWDCTKFDIFVMGINDAHHKREKKNFGRSSQLNNMSYTVLYWKLEGLEIFCIIDRILTIKIGF
jgi:hypothetical protein